MKLSTYTWRRTEEILVTEEEAARLKMIDAAIHSIETTLDGFLWNVGNEPIQKHFAQLETLHTARRLVLFGDSQVHIILPKPPIPQIPAQATAPAEEETSAQAEPEPILRTWTTREGDGTPVFVVSIKRGHSGIPYQRRFPMVPEIGGNILVGTEWQTREDAIAVTYLDLGWTPPTT